ncbi:MAG: SUMF1/EgtB/PvdO family nonheme iron enzyme [Candidatus Zhuqueibacterota bacterium]
MIEIAGFIGKILSEKALEKLLNNIFNGNKSALQKAYEKAFENTVNYYEYNYRNKYGAKNNRFFNYQSAEEELIKLTFVRQNPDPDMLAQIEWEHGVTTPPKIILDFVNYLRYQMSQFRECEDILVEKDKYQSLMNIDKNTDGIARNIKELTNHFVKKEPEEDTRPLHWKHLYNAFKDRKLHEVSIKHVGGGLLGPETLPLEDVFFVQDAGFRWLGIGMKSAKVQKKENKNSELFDELTVCEGHVWRALQELQINTSHIRKIMDGIDKEKILKIAAEFAVKYNKHSTVFGNQHFQQIVDQLAQRFELTSSHIIAALSLYFTETIKREPVLDLLKPPCSAFVIGDAGVGKTTVMRRLALNLFHRLENGEENVPLPLFVRLDKIEDYIKEKQSIHQGKKALLQYIADHWKSHVSHESDISASAIEQCELPLQIMLDGLDEIPSANIREKLILVIRDLVQGQTCNIIITSRPTAVDTALIKTSELNEIRLLELTSKQTNEFVNKFFEIYNCPKSGKADSAKFKSALELSDAAMLFAGNPLYLTVMILMHKKNEVLPKKRLELYAEFYQMLLLQRSTGQFKGKLADRPALRIQDEKIIHWGEAVYTPLLQWIAYLTHSNDADSVSIEKQYVIDAIKKEDLQQELKLISLENLAERFINFADEELGLLVSRGQFYGFSHRSLQEFLAAMHLADYQKEPSIEQFWTDQALKKPDRWMEVARLLFCKILDKKFFATWVRDINDTKDPRVIRLIQSIIFDLEEFFPGGGGIQSQKESVQKALVSRRDKSHGSPDMFLACSDALGSMDVPPISIADPPVVKLVAREPFTMGINYFDDDTKPEFKATLSPYYMGQYPVTNKEFAEFINDGGYTEEKYWRSSHEMFTFDGKKILEDLKNKTPEYWDDERFGKKRPLVPVVGVSWYEAMAYCLWWNEKYGAAWAESHGRKKILVRLPTEAEWEFAARGYSGRKYAWGDENIETDRCNFSSSNLDRTSTVGSYPRGKTPDVDLYDLSGNVWEWCIDWYNEKFYAECKRQGVVENPVCASKGSYRVMRGGSWDFTADYCRSANRSRGRPGRRNSLVGFRLVFVPQSVV